MGHRKYTDSFLKECINRRKNGESWNEIAGLGFDGKPSDIRRACAHYLEKGRNATSTVATPCGLKSTEEHLSSGEISFEKKVFLDRNFEKTPDFVLKALGYDPEKWTVVTWKFTEWDVKSRDEDKVAYSISGRIKPRTLNEMRGIDYFNAAKEFFRTHSLGYQTSAYPSIRKSNVQSDNFLIEIPAIELHLGKRSHVTDTPENYDIKDAERCFNKIFDTVIRYAQNVSTIGNCLLVIGNDFFNAEFNNQTTNGTPQQNDGRYKKLFIKGMELYTNAIEQLIPVFNHIDVRLCQGNHAQSAEFYLYHSLSQYFRNVPNVDFSTNYRTTQAYVFGDVGIFFTHGDENEKRTIASIPAEFPEEWGNTKFRELHLGHLHKEGATIIETGGMITRRIPSPCAVDDWHYNKRFIGNQRCHQFFVWGKHSGLIAINYINV